MINSTQNMPTFCVQINDKRLTKSVGEKPIPPGNFNAPLLSLLLLTLSLGESLEVS